MAGSKGCYRHPNKETRVSCASCERPICTDCMVTTEVGIKCRECARLPRSARAGVMKSKQIAKSLLAGALVAVTGWAVVLVILQIGFFSLILSAAAGYGAGTLIYRAGGHNGGPISMIIAAVAVLIPFISNPRFLIPLLDGSFPGFVVLPALLAIGFAIYASKG